MRKIIVTLNPDGKTGYDYVCTTIAQAVNLISGSTDIEIDEGAYSVSSLAAMSKAGGSVVWHGHCDKTILMPLTNTHCNNPACPLTFNDMIIMPSDAFSGVDTRVVWYSNCDTPVQWNNVLFLRSYNKIYPTMSFVFTYNTRPMPLTRNKYFFNCVFDSGIDVIHQIGVLKNCIQIKQNDDDVFRTLGTVTDTGQYITLINCHADYVDDNYVPLNHKDIGLYNGPYPWPSCSRFIKEHVKQDLIQKTKEILVHYNV